MSFETYEPEMLVAELRKRLDDLTIERDRALEEEARSQAEWRRLGSENERLTELVEDLTAELTEGRRRIEQLLLCIDHADREHDGKLMSHEGEVENARLFLLHTRTSVGEDT